MVVVAITRTHTNTHSLPCCPGHIHTYFGSRHYKEKHSTLSNLLSISFLFFILLTVIILETKKRKKKNATDALIDYDHDHDYHQLIPYFYLFFKTFRSKFIHLLVNHQYKIGYYCKKKFFFEFLFLLDARVPFSCENEKKRRLTTKMKIDRWY